MGEGRRWGGGGQGGQEVYCFTVAVGGKIELDNIFVGIFHVSRI